VPGVDSSSVPGFIGNLFLKIFYTMAKILEITPINHIYFER
jgi:hypothetical protein